MEITTMKYVCKICGYEYDEAVGEESQNVAAGTKWADVPEDFACPYCGVDKSNFEEA
jgi:rubredoxin